MTTVSLADIKIGLVHMKLPEMGSPEVFSGLVPNERHTEIGSKEGPEAIEPCPQRKMECTLEQAAHLDCVSLNMLITEYKNSLLCEYCLRQGHCILSF